MKKISSERTGFYKKGLPVPIFIAIVGTQFFRNLIWDLVDEVCDCGDSLLVRVDKARRSR